MFLINVVILCQKTQREQLDAASTRITNKRQKTTETSQTTVAGGAIAVGSAIGNVVGTVASAVSGVVTGAVTGLTKRK